MKELKVKVAGKAFRYTVNFFHSEGFTQLMPVVLGKSVDPLGPDPGSSIVSIPEIQYQGETLRLVTSMILHKQVAVKKLRKLFIMSPNVRLERPERESSKRHLFEFTQADFEMAGAKMEDVFQLVEKYYAGLTPFLKKEAGEEFELLGKPVFEFEPPFKKYTTHELQAEFGKEWEVEASKAHQQPFWALCHQREFYDKEDPLEPGHYLNYDLIYPLGFGEGLSGAEREHQYDRLLQRITKDKLESGSYAAYLSLAKEGFGSSAGGGIGMERLARFLTRAEHVAEVAYFARVPGRKIDI